VAHDVLLIPQTSISGTTGKGKKTASKEKGKEAVSHIFSHMELQWKLT
jgi:hypothetical protein